MSPVAPVANQVKYDEPNYPRNCWWVAARQEDVGREPFAVWMLDSPVVLFRTEDGKVVALENRCLHRWAPISSGYVDGDTITCGYHGAVFDAGGRCLKYPTQDKVPSSARVKSYAVIERAPFIWVWMGDPALAEAAPAPPAFEWAHDPTWVVAQDGVAIDANYFLLHENVLDLTHFNYLHRNSLMIEDQPVPTFKREGDVVSFTLVRDPYFPRPWQFEMNGEHAHVQESYSRFVTPAIHISQVTVTDREAGPDERAQFNIFAIHCVTPESPHRMRYWYLFGQDHGQGPGAADALGQTIASAAAEDKSILEAIQEMLKKDPRGMNVPEFSFTGDSGGVQARRVLLKLLEEDAAHGGA